MLDARDIRKSFGNTEVLKGISFTLDKAQVLSVIGPSGSGKSTLLRIVTQLEKADGGSLVIDDIPLFSDTPSGCVYNKENMKAASLKTGLVFQNFNLSLISLFSETSQRPSGLSLKKAVRKARQKLSIF